MKLFEKIDFLMRITNTSNSALGKYLTFDASYISRIRSGKRSFPKNPTISDQISLYFSEHITDDYQKQIAGELLCPGKDWPSDSRLSQKLISAWLKRPEQQARSPVGSIISGMASVKAADLPSGPDTPEVSSLPKTDITCYYGNPGKRQAVILFLTELSQMEHPPRLLLYSNEEFDWMYEDPEFARQWALLLFSYIRHGGTIRIAHTISRASGEMLVALQKWIPIYMTGAVEPYYYPKILDRVFRKTMFIAEGHSAILGSSVGEHTEEALNILIRDQAAVRSAEKEYWSFLELCKPLMQIFNMTKTDAFSRILCKFFEYPECTITVHRTPSFYTMPQSVAKSMALRQQNSWISRQQEMGSRAFSLIMDSGSTLTEILNLPQEEEIRKGQVPVPLNDFLSKPGLMYTAEEFRCHLDHVIELLKCQENYHVILSSAIPANEIVYVKEDTGVILVKSDLPCIAFVIGEQRMVSAFWDYLAGLKDIKKRKQETIRQLEALRNRL